MAPYLIRHPKLVSQWMLVRKTAVSRVVNLGEVNQVTLDKLDKIMTKVLQHISENNVPDIVQIKHNENLFNELTQGKQWLLADGISVVTGRY